MRLKLCPFCGNDVQKQYELDSRDTVYPVDREQRVWNVLCGGWYGYGGCSASILGDSAEDAMNNWNRRNYNA